MPELTMREKLIEAGHGLFYREGFLAVGLDRVLNEVGCSKQTFYNHFESKDDLIVAVIDEHHRWWSSEVRDRIERAAGGDARAQILAMFDVMHEIIHDPEYHGCIFINAAVEFPQPHHPAHQSARKAKVDGLALRGRVARAGKAVPGLLRDLEASGVGLESIEVMRPTLDDVFLTLTGRSLRDADETANPADENGEGDQR